MTETFKDKFDKVTTLNAFHFNPLFLDVTQAIFNRRMSSTNNEIEMKMSFRYTKQTFQTTRETAL